MNEEQFLHKVRAELDASEQSLDAATLSRLNQARQKALAQDKKPAWIIWLPAAATASIVAALIGGNLLIQKPDIENHSQSVAFEDIELLTSEADFELLQNMDMLEVMADDAS
ncbi:MAG: hypothetical protein QG652_892 [Pseudomonadota bacterium]|nr:hypothetical protein [Pseudomonadota bacterium]